MKYFAPLFQDRKVAFFTGALGLVVATLFIARPTPNWPVNTVAILLLVLAWIIEGAFATKLIPLKQAWIWPPILLFAVYLIGVAYSDNTDVAWSVTERKLSLLLLPLLVGTSASFKKEHAGWTLFVFVWSGVVAMLIAYALGTYHAFSNLQITEWLDAITYYELAESIGFQPIYLSFFMVFVFYALLGLYADQRFTGQWFHHKKWRAFPLMAFAFVSVIMLSSRMEVMVLFVTGAALIAIFLSSPKLRKRYAVLMMTALVAAVLLIMSSHENRERFTEMFDLTADYTENKYGGRSIRLHKWKNALECWAQQPLLGTGTGDMQQELDSTYAENDFDLALQYHFNPHNQYIETLLTVGISGFALLVFWLWGMIWMGFKNKNWLLFAFGIIVSMSVLTESMLERHWGVVFIALFGAVLLTDNFKYFSDNTEKSS